MPVNVKADDKCLLIVPEQAVYGTGIMGFLFLLPELGAGLVQIFYWLLLKEKDGGGKMGKKGKSFPCYGVPGSLGRSLFFIPLLRPP